MNTSIKRDNALSVIRIVVWIFMVGAAAISFMHIVETGYSLGLGIQSWAAPFLIDGIAIVGKVSMLPRFSRSFRRSGLRLLMLGGLLSLACNVYAGSNFGQRAFGVLVVAGFMALESHAAKASSSALVPEPELTIGQKAAATRKANAAAKAAAQAGMTRGQKAAATRKANLAKKAAEVAALEAEFAMQSAPVSPTA